MKYALLMTLQPLCTLKPIMTKHLWWVSVVDVVGVVVVIAGATRSAGVVVGAGAGVIVVDGAKAISGQHLGRSMLTLFFASSFGPVRLPTPAIRQ